MVATELRNEILSGVYAEGELFPRQQDLVDRFGVSPPPVREALRILETEGLISVQRGREGGAVVHRPRLAKVTYMLGMVLQADGVPVEDAIAAYGHLEPLIASMCAAQPDRATTIVPVLRENVALAASTLPDGRRFRTIAAQFHREMHTHVGNRTVAALILSLDVLVSSQIKKLSTESGFLRAFDDIDIRRASLREHELLVERVAAGDEDGAYDLAREHMSEAHWPTSLPAQPPIIEAGLIQ
jgi:DNA-binding FadR family transcriptional regulator